MKKKTLYISTLSTLCILGGSLGVFAKESPVKESPVKESPAKESPVERIGIATPCFTASMHMRAYRLNETKDLENQGLQGNMIETMVDVETTTFNEEETKETPVVPSNPCPYNHEFCDGLHNQSGNPLGNGTLCIHGYENCDTCTGGIAEDGTHVHANQSGMHQGSRNGNGNGVRNGNMNGKRDGSGACIRNQ